jgi:branched-chain amino acid transport system substrate-binding protein
MHEAVVTVQPHPQQPSRPEEKEAAMLPRIMHPILSLVLLLAPVAAWAAEEIPIGIVLPMSGPLAKVGLTNLWGHELAVEDINAAGGIKSMGGSKLKLIVADSQGKPEIGNSETERLIREGVTAIAGAYQSAVTFTGTQVSERYRTPYLVPVSIADKITERRFKYTFRPESKASWFARDQFRAIRDFAKQTSVAVERVAILYEDTLYGQSTAEGQRQYAKEMGWEIAADISYPANTPDMTATVAKLKAARPDVVVHNSYLQDSILLARTSKELDFTPKAFFAAGAGPKDPNFVKQIGKDAEHWLVISEWNPDMKREGAAELGRRFLKKYGQPMDGIAAMCYITTWVLKDGLERAGSANREKLRAALAKTDITSGPGAMVATGQIRFDETGQNDFTNLVTQIIDGEQRTVWPREVAARPVVFPIPKWKERK